MKTVFITGATTGIGLYTARQLHSMGWEVFAGVFPNEDTSALTAHITERLHLIEIDVTNTDMIRSAQDAIRRQTDTLDALVNNAGTAITGPMEVLPIEDIRRQMEVNYIGQIAVTQAMLPLIRAAQGRIVNVASILGRLVVPFSGPYCASKFAVQAFTDALRMELRPWKIPVIAIQPTVIQSAIWQKQLEWQEMVREELPPHAQEMYAEQLTIMEKSTRDQQAIAASPQVVADAIAEALNSPNPKTRYTVGPDALILTLLWRFLPDSLRDQVLMRRLKMW